MSGIESIKDDICAAFCSEISVRRVPAGLAVSTGFRSFGGDQIGFYIVRNELNTNQFRLEDSGTLVPMLEADGVNLSKGVRADLFKSILSEYGAEFDEDTRVLQSRFMFPQELASASLRFLAMLLRVQDLEVLNPVTVENTFVEDARKAISAKFKGKASVEFNGVVSEDLTNYVVDAIIRPDGFAPVAVYFATNQSKADEAVILRMEANIKHAALKVVLLLETATPQIPKRSLTRAHNFLDATPVFEGRAESMDKIHATAMAGGITRN